MMLKLEDVHTFYGQIEALKGVSLDVHPGEIVTLIGANGAGKSTLLLTICGSPQSVHAQSAGSARVDSEAPSAWIAVRRFVMQGLLVTRAGRRALRQSPDALPVLRDSVRRAVAPAVLR